MVASFNIKFFQTFFNFTRRQMVAGVFIFVAFVVVFLIIQGRAQEELTVTVLDVGQGDAIFIEMPDGERWLIDGGPNNSIMDSLDKHLPFGDRRLTGIILTHPHADHVSGLVEVIRRYKVDSVIMTEAVHTSPVYMAWLAEVNNRGLNVISATKSFRLEGKTNKTPWRWEFIYPSTENLSSELNDTSVVSRLVFGYKSFLFTGDISVEVEKLLVDQRQKLESTVLKVSHHGSVTSTGADFLEAVSPEYAVISVGGDNRFGHPDPVVLTRLKKFGVKIFRTDRNGEIIFKTNGEYLSLKTFK